MTSGFVWKYGTPPQLPWTIIISIIFSRYVPKKDLFPCFPQNLNPENPDITFFSKALHSLEPCQPWVALAPWLRAAQAERPATWGEADSAWYWCAWSRFPDPDLGWSPWKCWGEAWPIVIISYKKSILVLYTKTHTVTYCKVFRTYVVSWCVRRATPKSDKHDKLLL